jgi:hypothetical protein
MANKQINELTEKTDPLVDDDYILVYDSEEAGSEKAKKVAINNYIGTTTDYNIYVATTGSDVTGDGSSGNPFASIDKALSWTDNKYLVGVSNWVISVADGTYSSLDSIVLFHHAPNNRYTIIGNTSNPENVVLNFNNSVSDGFSAYYQAFLDLRGMTINCASGGTFAIRVSNLSNVYINYVRVIGSWTYGIFGTYNSLIDVRGIEIDGGGGKTISHGIRISDNSHANFSTNASTINNCANNGIHATGMSSARILTTINMSGNGTDYNPTINSTGNNNSLIYNS